MNVIFKWALASTLEPIRAKVARKLLEIIFI